MPTGSGRRWDDPSVAEKILRTYRTFAVVGYSANPRRPSHGVARFLVEVGYRVFCVNPNETMSLEGATCYRDLRSIPEPVEVVDLFRRPDLVMPHVEEAIEVGAKAVWMQLGVINEAAAERAAAAGLEVVMDRCPHIDFRPEFLSRS